MVRTSKFLEDYWKVSVCRVMAASLRVWNGFLISSVWRVWICRIQKLFCGLRSRAFSSYLNLAGGRFTIKTCRGDLFWQLKHVRMNIWIFGMKKKFHENCIWSGIKMKSWIWIRVKEVSGTPLCYQVFLHLWTYCIFLPSCYNMAGLWIRFHFLWIRIQLFFSMRIRIRL